MAGEDGGREQESRRVDTRLDASSQLFPRFDRATWLAPARCIRPPPYYLDYGVHVSRLPRWVLKTCAASQLSSVPRPPLVTASAATTTRTSFPLNPRVACPSGEAPDKIREHILAECSLYERCGHRICAVLPDIFSATIFCPTSGLTAPPCHASMGTASPDLYLRLDQDLALIVNYWASIYEIGKVTKLNCIC